jgi:uncharacterized membrane protein YdjX (TVP38/TMEM64 family)
MNIIEGELGMVEFFRMLLDPDFYYQIIEVFGPFGFIAGILLTMIEAFFPPLPLAVFVTVNIITFGFLGGYVYSYIGTVIGSYIVFLIFCKFGQRFMNNYIEKHSKAKSMLHWIHNKGVFPIIVLLTFPFTPSVIVSGLAALAKIKHKEYLVALIFGKMFMILSLSFIGVNIQSFVSQPVRSIMFIVLTLCVSLLAKVILTRYEKRVLRGNMVHGKTMHRNDK